MSCPLILSFFRAMENGHNLITVKPFTEKNTVCPRGLVFFLYPEKKNFSEKQYIYLEFTIHSVWIPYILCQYKYIAFFCMSKKSCSFYVYNSLYKMNKISRTVLIYIELNLRQKNIRPYRTQSILWRLDL